MTRLRLQTVSTANASTLLSAFRTLSGDDCEEIIKMPSQMDMASWISPSIILIFLDMLVSLASTLLTRWWVGQLGRTFKLGYLQGLHACSTFLGALFHLNQSTSLVSFLESVLVVVFFFFFFSRFRLWYVETKVTQYVLHIQLKTEKCDR